MSSAFGSILNSAAAIVVVFGLCLLCHELGHFLWAKLFGMQVDEFALGFGRALWRWRRGETTYRLNIFPYGAYVRIAGMEPGSPPMERGFHSRPRWQGALVILGGSVANLLLAGVLFTSVAVWVGVIDPSDTGIYVGKVMPHSPAAESGLRPGDQLIGVDGQSLSLHVRQVAPGSPAARAGIRKGDYLERVDGHDVYVPSDLCTALQSAKGSHVTLAVVDYGVSDLSKQQRMVQLFAPTELKGVAPKAATSALARAWGLRFDDLTQAALMGYIATRAAKPIRLRVRRDEQVLQTTVTPSTVNGRYAMRDENGMLYSRIRPVGRIGVVLRPATRPVSPSEALTIGLVKSVASAGTVVLSVRAMIHHEVEAELAGPVAIMAISAERAKIGWDAVLNWGGMISSILAVVNLFPIPPFDGFRFLLLGYEAAIGRRIDAQIELILSIAGFAVIVFVFATLTFKDVSNLVRYGTP